MDCRSPDLLASRYASLAALANPAGQESNLEEVAQSDLLQIGHDLFHLLPEDGVDPAGLDDETRLLRDAAWLWLDITRQAPFLRRISKTSEGERWLALVLGICERTHFTVGPLFAQRAIRQPTKGWLHVIKKDGIEAFTLEEIRQRVASTALGLHAHLPWPSQGQPVAVMAENSLEVAVSDLACLTTGLVNVTIPADITGEQAAYILEQTEARLLLLGSDRQVEKILPFLAGLPRLQWVYQIGQGERPGTRATGVSSLEELLRRGETFDPEELARRGEAVRWQDTATVMYTSGTTGLPKGILFSQRNLLAKRFARALAWPQIGEGDSFLCYLPLYHTFGRWLELLGTLFWGASYHFMENPALETMVDNLRRVAPTVLISIPKKWIQLCERMQQEIPEGCDAHLARLLVEETTGGRLRWGISAAGYLTPSVFRFFQGHGIELASGFGMTEATGGITMTPVGEYREGTVGRALPGIEISRAQDGELLIRGPYVMKGYLGPDEVPCDYTREWFHTGDIVEIDGDGYVTIVDRKKDIYKNVKGQTISPQRIERFFQSFGEISQAFLVGDGREYNTLLVRPNYAYDAPSLKLMSPDALREYLGTIIASINGFLAPYERILDFVLLPRPLTLEHEELTSKATYRRKVVEEHFAGIISEMYLTKDTRVVVDGVEVRFPHWLLRELGVTRTDVQAEPGGVRLARLDRRLTVIREAETDRVRLGDLNYAAAAPRCDLEQILRSPELWLGNAAFIRFAGASAVRRPQIRPEPTAGPVLGVESLAGTPELVEEELRQLGEALWREDRSLMTLHLAATALLRAGEKEGLRLVEVLESVAAEEDVNRSELARIALRRAVRHELREIRSAAFRALLPNGAPDMVDPTIRAFLAVDPMVLNPAGAQALSKRGLPGEIMSSFLAFLGRVHREREDRRTGRKSVPQTLDEERTLSLLRFLVIYASDHPAFYRAARGELTRWFLFEETQRLQQFARKGCDRLVQALRAWLGPHPSMAVEPHTAREYGWGEIVRFDPACAPADRARIDRALRTLPLIEESVFVLHGGIRLSLADIPRGGLRVLPLGVGHGKAVYRLSLETVRSGAFEVALNLNRDLSRERLESEVHWLIRLGELGPARRLSEEVGGVWLEEGLWTEEYVPGETVVQLVTRVAAGTEEPEDRLIPLWRHAAGSAVAAYVDFWNRTGRKFVPGDPSGRNLIVPAHDYQEGSRIVSVSEIRPFVGLSCFFRDLKDGVLEALSSAFPALARVAGCDLIYAGLLEVFGEEEGTELLEGLLSPEADLEAMLPGESEGLRAFLGQVHAGEHMPRRLAAAMRRYHRWAAANPASSRAAKARTLSDLWESYGLHELEEGRSAIRLRFFRGTVLASAGPGLRDELARLISQARAGGMSFEHLLREMSEVVRRVDPSEEDAYFLARMTYAHLRPADTADLTLIEQGGTRRTDLVVTHRDHAGHYFRIRHAGNPREVWDLYRLFLDAGLETRFRPGHQFLVAVDETGKVLGGLFYRVTPPAAVHLEKVVVSQHHRGRGISEELMADFFDRMRALGTRAVTTGFFRPQYFRRFHFQVDREHAGLVRLLDPPA